MNPDVKGRWVTALRSGLYEQGRGVLMAVSDDGPARFCCLGVLCMVAVADGVIDPPKVDPDWGAPGTTGAFGPKGATILLPKEVREWAGIHTDDGSYCTERDGHWSSSRSLTGDNDTARFSFPEIADIIEEHF